MSNTSTGLGARVIRWSERALRSLIWALTAYSLFISVIALYDWIRHPLAASPYAAFEGHAAFRAFAVFVGAPLIALIGFLILRQQRGNLVGALLISWVGGFAAWGISVEIQPALYYIVSLPLNAWWTGFILLPYLFPDGQAYPRWLTPYLLVVMLIAILSGVTMVFAAPAQGSAGQPANPFYLPGAEAFLNPLSWLSIVSLAALLPGIFLSPMFRYRQAGFRQRQQIKAFTWSSMVLLLPYFIFYFAAGAIYGGSSNAPALLRAVMGAAVGIVGLVPPIAIGYSILRHRLFDIDVVIRRTLVYSVVTSLLAIAFYGSVLLFQRILTAVTGQQSAVAIVASTLVIAALFGPLRRRVQDLVDRRFYRRRYNAQQVLGHFAAIARDETDIDRLAGGLEAAIEETMRPATIGTWVART